MAGGKYSRTRSIQKVTQQFRKSLKKTSRNCGDRLYEESEEPARPSDVSG
jgi:hypothetical protein